MDETGTSIEYIDADFTWQERISVEWGEMQARHMHFNDGFSILALHAREPIGLLSVCWQPLTAPLTHIQEGYIDIIEVVERFRGRGIAKALVGMAVDRARRHGAYQLRAWSSDERREAIQLWAALGFGMCPAAILPAGNEVRGYFATLVL